MRGSNITRTTELSASVGLLAALQTGAEAEGFAESGGVDLDRVLGTPTWSAHVSRYDDWLKQGRQGEMQYLMRGRDRRADPRLVLPGARSIFSVMLPYRKTPAGSLNPERGPRYARYLHGRDYHLDIAERLERVAEHARRETGIGFEAKACVDTSAVLERSWAALAGLGWIGKNTLLIHPRLGSYFFLGSLLLSEPLGKDPSPLPDYCGSCTRCLKACPTQALPSPHELDSNRCISYWTLEKRGELDLSPADQKAMGTWVAGCDLCQEACPFNLKAARSELAPPPNAGAIALEDWSSLVTESESDYRTRVRESSLNRVKPVQFVRNLKIAQTNALSGGTSNLVRETQDL